MRQPLTLLVKVRSGRRAREVLPAARFWVACYGAIGGLHVVGLVLRGFGYVLWLALPGVPVFVWYLALIGRRAERRQWPVEVLGAGSLALSAPAAMWVGLGRPDPLGWALWVLTWAQSANSIAYAYLRLRQRSLDHVPPLVERLRSGRIVLATTFGALLLVAAASLLGELPRWLFVPYAVQATEALLGVVRPALGLGPRRIGYRQLLVSVLFTLAFMLAWSH